MIRCLIQLGADVTVCDPFSIPSLGWPSPALCPLTDQLLEETDAAVILTAHSAFDPSRSPESPAGAGYPQPDPKGRRRATSCGCNPLHLCLRLVG